MKKSLLIISHLASGSSELCNILDQNSRVQWCHSNLIYNHPSCLDSLFSHAHKTDDASAIWMDELFYNYQFAHKAFYNRCKFIYVIRDANCLYSMINSKQQADYFFRYYVYRLRRICEMAKRTPGAVLMTWNNLSKNLKGVEEYLNLKDKLNAPLIQPLLKNKFVSSDLISKAQDSYERHFYYLKNLNLNFI